MAKVINGASSRSGLELQPLWTTSPHCDIDAIVKPSTPTFMRSTKAHESRARSVSPPRRAPEGGQLVSRTPHRTPSTTCMSTSVLSPQWHSISSPATRPRASPRKTPSSSGEKFHSAVQQLDLRLEAAVLSKKRQDLESVIADAEERNFSEEKLAPARQLLAQQLSKEEVRKAVSAEQRALARLSQAFGISPATPYGQAPELPHESRWEACSKAVEAGIEAQALCRAAGLKQSERNLVKATSAVLEPLREAVLLKVRSVVSGSDRIPPVELAQEIAWARLTEVLAWQHVLERAQLISWAKPLLEQAVKENTAPALRPAIEKARAAGLDPEDIAVAERALAAIERRASVKWCLFVAMMGTSAPLLRLAIDDAEGMRAPRKLMDGPRELLGVLEELYEVAIALCHNLRKGDPRKIEHVLKAAEQLNAERDPMCKELIVAGSKELTRINKRAEARKDLLQATNTRKSVVIKNLPTAIKKAETAGLKEEEIDAASKVYTKALAAKNMEKAMQSKSVDLLRQAIREGMRAKLPSEQIREALRIMKEEELMKSVNDLIARAPSLRSLEKGIEGMISAASADGIRCESAALKDIRARVRRMRTEIDAAEALLKAPIIFDTDSTEIPMAELPKLHQKIKVLKQHPLCSLKVVACSTHHSSAVAQRFSMERASTVVDLFKRAGCTNAMTTKAYGNPKGEKSRRDVSIIPDLMSIGPQMRAQLQRGMEETDGHDGQRLPTSPDQADEGTPLYKLRRVRPGEMDPAAARR